jgi:putative glutamine amidotransferase
MRPLIGIPPSLDGRGRWRAGRRYHYLHDAYARAVAETGGLPVYLPVQPEVDGLLARLDGLLLPGGDDLPPDPEREGPPPEGVTLDLVPEEQLAFDTRLLEAALARPLPVLAICYGMQLLARVCGGRLHAHLPSDRPEGAAHRLPEADGRHGITVAEGSVLARVLGDAPPVVNSLHHQGVSDAGRLRVCARAEDDLIEAVEDPGARFCLGLQWHPEQLEGPGRERPFAAFVAACRGS